MEPGAQQKTMLKNILQKIENVQKMTPKWFPKSEFILGVAPPGAPLVAQTIFGHENGPPALPKCSQ